MEQDLYLKWKCLNVVPVKRNTRDPEDIGWMQLKKAKSSYAVEKAKYALNASQISFGLLSYVHMYVVDGLIILEEISTH